MKKSILLVSVIFLLLTTNSCMISGIAGSRNVTSESRSIDETFTAFKVSQGIEVQLTQDKNTSLIVEMDDNLHELLVTKVEDGVLDIHFTKNVGKRKASIIHLTMPKIEKIATSSGANVQSVNTLNIDNITIDGSSGSNIQLRLDADSITTNSSSGSSIQLEGFSNILSVDASSGSNINTEKLVAKTVIADASSGATIYTNATEKLKANASSGGNITCKGSPNEKEVSKSSGGSVSVQ